MLASLLLPSPPHATSIPHSVVSLQSSLILDGTLQSKLGKSTFSSVPSVLSSLHFLSVGSPFCTPLTLKRGIKWPWIGQEVGVSPLCRFRKKCEARGKRGRGRRYDEDFVLVPLLTVAFHELALSAFVLSKSVSLSFNLFPPASRFFSGFTFSRG